MGIPQIYGLFWFSKAAKYIKPTTFRTEEAPLRRGEMSSTPWLFETTVNPTRSHKSLISLAYFDILLPAKNVAILKSELSVAISFDIEHLYVLMFDREQK